MMFPGVKADHTNPMLLADAAMNALLDVSCVTCDFQRLSLYRTDFALAFVAVTASIRSWSFFK